MGGLFSGRVAEPTPQTSGAPRLTTTVAILYSYIGTGLHGLQWIDGLETLETHLFSAMVAARLLPEEPHTNLARVKWNQASRTDAGVHAAAQVLTCFIAIPDGHKLKDVASLINDHKLPRSPFHVWAVLGVPTQWKAQKSAESRRYGYLMPFSALSDQSITHLNHLRSTILPVFVGTRNFHNYTKKVSPDSATALRTIFEFSISDPFDIEGNAFVLWTIYGQSFMMNQIRKMIFVVICFSHTLITIEDAGETLTRERWALAKAPACGLFLDKVEYDDSSLKKFRVDPDNARLNLRFDAYRPLVEKWKNDLLIPHIARTLTIERIFETWQRDVLFVYLAVRQSDPRVNRHRGRLPAVV
jgi:tRNA pseudouridine38-40 synthase